MGYEITGHPTQPAGFTTPDTKPYRTKAGAKRGVEKVQRSRDAIGLDRNPNLRVEKTKRK